MSKVEEKDILHVAKLARIGLADNDLHKYAQELVKIIDYVNMLQAVDTNDCQPTYSVGSRRNVMRPDEPVTSLDRELVLSTAPRRDLVNIRTKGVFHE